MSTMPAFAAVAAGGALGACARFSVTLWLADNSARFPFGTLAANLTGALLAGFIVTVLLSRGLSTSPVHLLLVTGFLGSFTTLSAFSVETLKLAQSGAVLAAVTYVLATLLGAFAMALLGMWMARVLS